MMFNRLQSALRRRDAKLRRELRNHEEVTEKKPKRKNWVQLQFSDNQTAAVGDT